MLYPIAITIGDEKHAYGVVVPDVPGCFSAGDTLEEAFMNAKEAITFHIEGMLEDGDEIPQPKPIEQHQQNTDFQDFILTFVEVDLSHLLGKSEKINVTLPSLLIKRIDQFVATHPEYKNRSQFLTKIATDRVFA
ncbi:type II toxin-antitoxin system HicB family antitoxin [Testudinibacter sp. TR-2022]|uniref:type II toxin-antitoxin system HicB family antitoxin n=1 Tax=Testudinibacter sp. TR-2022 TaxID=2585029 RepID=UPI001119A84A|nr:type II toxin-antitoxin system HicB family antitoxin [Testudinibacter sp. TR-2022]TNH00175.1 type II toxin-antitoxin system HicB family antitoxin [Pasteurellaceae bacterium Phil31]TNH06812.1 type II toxin-antitoxin system HicB family antitoxin [Testudinibacter sp. TR-2022]TNH07372.1 type II toxin-antitoxin system HicB family antitoxin [Testudinibacter sp. TR-2022]TNH11213.1 type II toxin-antitoxin system HicB family antitoxin [Testudinibacter sp. TR-2022]TNH16259.1 type II toxin-antitoxin s